MKISCIICAYNEGPRMRDVLRAVSGHPLLGQVIVVDDGSSDDTASIARSYPGIEVISHPKNLGKSAAMASGIEAARCDTLALFDADLIGITPEDVTALIEPVASGAADVSISLRRNAFSIYLFMGLDFSSGERIIPKRLLAEHLSAMAGLPRFAIEIGLMNELFIKEKLRIAVVYWPGVSGLMKWRKMGIVRGMLADLKMSVDVLRVVSVQTIFRQNYLLLRRIVNPGKKALPLFKRKLSFEPPVRAQE